LHLVHFLFNNVAILNKKLMNALPYKSATQQAMPTVLQLDTKNLSLVLFTETFYFYKTTIHNNICAVDT